MESLVCGLVTHDRSHQNCLVLRGSSKWNRRNIRPRAKRRRGLVGLFAHHDVRELCQNLHDRIHQSWNRKSFGDSGLLLNRASPCVLFQHVCMSILIKGVGFWNTFWMITARYLKLLDNLIVWVDNSSFLKNFDSFFLQNN